jgi:murein DD-endopeptidase MepM/ murein hydrolase activator NlpD
MRLAPFAALLLLAAAAPGAALRAQAPAPAPKLVLPLACEIGRSCEIQHYVDRDPGPGVLDYRCGHRTNDKHDGIDFRLKDMAAQRAGVDVLAAAAGRVVAVRDGVPDISIRAPGAPSVAGHECGNRVAIQLGGRWLIDYCHLAQGSLKVKVGDAVAAGQPLAHVGLSGDTEFPHLHFSVRHGAAVVDPFAPSSGDGCRAQGEPLWTPAVAAQMPYRAGAVLNTGFATGVASMAEIEDRAPPAPTLAAPAIVAYARLIGLELGDVVEITLSGPDGKTLATASLPPLDHDKAQVPAEVGRKRPPQGWAHGIYSGEVRVHRAGAVALTRRWQETL